MKKLLTKMLTKMNERLTWSRLLNNGSVSGGNTTIFNGRSLADYNILVIVWTPTDSLARESIVIPYPEFKSIGTVELSYVNSANVQSWADVKYVNDTTVNLTCKSGATGTIRMYGLT